MLEDLRDLFAPPPQPATSVKKGPSETQQPAPHAKEPKKAATQQPLPHTKAREEPKKAATRRPKKPRSQHSQSSSDSGVHYSADIEPEPYDPSLGEYTTLADLSTRKTTSKAVKYDSDSDAASSIRESRIVTFSS